MKMLARTTVVAALALALVGCASSTESDHEAERRAESALDHRAALQQAVPAMQLYLREHDSDYHARLVMALTLIELGEQEEANEAFEIIVNQAPSDSPEAKEARSRLQDDRMRHFIKGLPVQMPVWKGYPLTAVGALCVASDLRFPANRSNQFCSEPAPPQPLVYRACGNTQFGSPGRTVQLIAMVGDHSCDDLGFRGDSVTPAEIEEALTMLGDQVSPEFATRFRPR